MSYNIMTPDIAIRYQNLDWNEKRKLVKVDQETNTIFVEFEGQVFEIKEGK